MAFWFAESHTDNVVLNIRVDEQLYSQKSEYQKIDIFQTLEFGRILTLDDVVVLPGTRFLMSASAAFTSATVSR